VVKTIYMETPKCTRLALVNDKLEDKPGPMAVPEELQLRFTAMISDKDTAPVTKEM
jgi:hypothetical protein